MSEAAPNGNGNGRVSLYALSAVGSLAIPAIAGMFFWVNSIESRLQSQIAREVERNNKLEREMGAVQMVDQLFMQGKLRLDQ